jgi:imidazolonepropionase-like amidohydrolase
MTRRTFFLSPIVAPILLPSVAARDAATLMLTDVTVIDASGGVQANRTVVVKGDRIVVQGRADSVRAPGDARVISGRNRFLIPGLWDMHVHLSIARASALPILLANGVTGVRDMGGLLGELDQWRTRIDSGALAGPRIFRSGPIVNGKAFNNLQIAVENGSEARGAVRALHKSGADFIKVHAAIQREAYFAVAAECKELGMRFAGHIPRVITPEEASDTGQASLEHLDTVFDGTLAAGVKPEDMADAIVRFRNEGASALFRRFAKNGTSFTPTLVIERAGIHLEETKASAYDKYISRPARSMTQEMQTKYRDLFTTEYVARQAQQLQASLPLVSLMSRAGVRLLTGTDMGSSLLAPGYSLHEEMALLVEAGLSPMEVLRAATQAPARLLGRDDLGDVQEGKLADLVLLNANPLDNIRNTQKIHAVVTAGKLLDRSALDALLLAGQQAAQQGDA